MAMDPPARIAVIGGGPVGLEAALYGRYLGYQVLVLERGEVGEHVRRWGHVRMFSPFRMNSSPLGRAAIKAQAPQVQLPPGDAILTGRQWVEHYLHPLSRTDLLDGCIRTGCQVVAVARQHALKPQWPGQSRRAQGGFRLLVRTSRGEQEERADIVLDCSGLYATPNWLGPGGAPAVGEVALRDRIDYHLPDPLGNDRARLAGKRILVVGAGYSAATAIVQLAMLGREFPETSVTWVVRRANPSGPISRIPDDPLPQRDQLSQQANALAQDPSTGVHLRCPAQVRQVAWNESGQCFRVWLTDRPEEPQEFDVLLALVGYRPDRDIYRELQVQECYATEGPLRLAARLLGEAARDCLAMGRGSPEELRHPEPHFYILGAKSYGRNSQFLFAQGLEQIRQVYSILGDRADLDLYASAEKLPQ